MRIRRSLTRVPFWMSFSEKSRYRLQVVRKQERATRYPSWGSATKIGPHIPEPVRRWYGVSTSRGAGFDHAIVISGWNHNCDTAPQLLIRRRVYSSGYPNDSTPCWSRARMIVSTSAPKMCPKAQCLPAATSSIRGAAGDRQPQPSWLGTS